MPFSELLRMAKGKVESTQQKSTSDFSFAPDNDLVELVWENGQIMMQGQTSRARKNTNCNNLQSLTPKPREKELPTSKMGKFGSMDYVFNDFPLSGQMSLNQDEDNDDLVPWLNLPLDDSIQQDYYSDLLPDISGVTVNDLSTYSSFTPFDKQSSCSQITRGSYEISAHNGVTVEQGDSSIKPRGSHLYSPQTSFRSKPSDIIVNNATQNSFCNESNSSRVLASPATKQDPGSSSTNMGIMNFSHFSRPVALFKANLQKTSADKVGNKGSSESNKNPIESTPSTSDLSSPCNKDMDSSKPLLVPQSEAPCAKDQIKNVKIANPDVETMSLRKAENEKTVEPPIASSSVCSGNSVERASNDFKHNLKRKCHDNDDSECPSEDVEEDSVGVRKKADCGRGCTGSKRSRAAEVHNLSERRRRDRINEKMRALQELIPNCNKVDKASMLDEAIEYLKTLQLQVQILSMRSGMCVPPMMLPTGMQHMHASPMPHFSPMGIGMGMGMGVGVGYGMGVLDINGSGMFQQPHFASPAITGPSGLHAMAGGCNFQVFGLPGQGFPMSIPQSTTLFPLPSGPPMKSSTVGLNSSVVAGPMQTANAFPASGPKNPTNSITSQVMHTVDGITSGNQASNQLSQKANDGFVQPNLVQKNS